jgi:hypothetical protein
MLKKLQKKLHAKNIINVRAMEEYSFDFYHHVQKFSVYNFFWVNFFYFFQLIQN